MRRDRRAVENLVPVGGYNAATLAIFACGLRPAACGLRSVQTDRRPHAASNPWNFFRIHSVSRGILRNHDNLARYYVSYFTRYGRKSCSYVTTPLQPIRQLQPHAARRKRCKVARPQAARRSIVFGTPLNTARKKNSIFHRRNDNAKTSKGGK